MSIVIDSNLEGKIYDNECTSGEKLYSLANIAERMRCLIECFVLELWMNKLLLFSRRGNPVSFL